MTPPVIVYLGMGLLVARILLDGRQTRGFTWLQWLQYLVDVARIVLLWPLVLLVEKVEAWLKSDRNPPGYSVQLAPRENPLKDHIPEPEEIEPAGEEKR